MQKLIFILLLIGQSINGQIKPGKYSIISDSKTGRIELQIHDDKTFTYINRNHISCFVWYEIKGKWKIEFDKLILIDSVTAFKKKLNSAVTLLRTTIYRISKNKLIFNSQYHNKNGDKYIYGRNLNGNFSFIE
ncbi:MAG: hypothetical protein K2P85_00715 [Flavobacteriaceae bacterium]|nr:hypothetical protein [Flavobacteriaceae bacterium]